MLQGLVIVRQCRFFCYSARAITRIVVRSKETCTRQSTVNLVSRLIPTEIQPRRLKYSRKEAQPAEDEDDDTETEDAWDKGTSTKKCSVGSLRLDLIIKVGLGMARNKVETAFYESRIRINGKKVLKKSAHVNVGDEIDLIRGPSPSNPDFLVVSRVELLSAKPKDDGVVVHLKRHKSLIVENYEEPWGGSLA